MCNQGFKGEIHSAELAALAIFRLQLNVFMYGCILRVISELLQEAEALASHE
jgi:hypothetical protein